LEGRLDLADVAQINEDLLQVSTIQSVDIDLSGVTGIDAAGTRFLAFLQKEAQVAGKTCRLTNPSEAVLSALKFHGR
jgi:anti-anti-sigma regulatory factor